MRHIDDSAESVHAKIRRARQLKHTMVVFSGGEPTIRPEMIEWATHVASLGLELGFVTNGRRFAYPEFVEAMLARHLRYVYVSFHGGSARVHNSLVRSDAFSETLQGIRNLHGKVPVLTVNCVVTNTNIRKLRELVDLLLPLQQISLKFSMTAPKGGGDRLFDHIVPRVADCASAIVDAIQYGIERRGDAPGPNFGHDGLPLCLTPGMENLYDDLKTNDFRTMSEVGEPDFYPVDDILKVQPEDPCGDCALRGPCPGLYRGYVERFPEDVSVLKALPGYRGNSYNLTPTRDIARPPGAPCPVKVDGTTSYDRGRSLFLRLRDRMRLFEAHTRDFSDEEMLETKEVHGQLYLDISSKLAPDDFPKDLRKLRLLEECVHCEARPHCTGCWTPVRHDVFLADDERVHEILRELEGTVLDIGAGEGNYLATLAPKVEASTIRYTAVEPDAMRVNLLRRRYPWAQFLVAAAEDVSFDPCSIDSILLLRSYNHLNAPRVALPRLVEALRPGGSLLIVDNVAFGLVRSRAHAASAERGPGELEHRRNASAEGAHHVVSPLSLKLIERRDVGPNTSNQWLLRYEKI